MSARLAVELDVAVVLLVGRGRRDALKGGIKDGTCGEQ
jgi:hypothetical protein